MHTSLASPRRARRSARLAALAGAALLTLTGCLQADLGVTLNDDESGVFNVRMVVNRAQFAQLEEMFGGMMGEVDATVAEPEDPCAEMQDDMSTDELPPGATVEPIEDGEWCGAQASIPFANLEEFAEIAEDFQDTSDEDATSLGAPSITKTDGGYRFAVSGLSMSDESMGLGEGEGEDGMDEFSAMLEPFVQDMRISYDVRLPGNPVEHNADAVDGNRFQWTLEWGDTRTELFAETGAGEPDGSGDTGEVTDTPAAPGDDGAATGDDDAGIGDDGAATGDDGAATGDDAVPGAVDDDDGSSLTWLWILLGVVAVAAIAGFVIYKNKRGKDEPGAPLPPPGQPSPGWQPPAE